MRGATYSVPSSLGVNVISIHAPLAGCDCRYACKARYFRNFNPRTPCGVRLKFITSDVLPIEFQSTHPLRGATASRKSSCAAWTFQSTHPLRGATHPLPAPAPWGCNFNPRTPCGVRPPRHRRSPRPGTFQSTHPLRGATSRTFYRAASCMISIHAPLAGCDAAV